LNLNVNILFNQLYPLNTTYRFSSTVFWSLNKMYEVGYTSTLLESKVPSLASLSDRRIRPGWSGWAHARISGLLRRRCSIRWIGDDAKGSRQTAETVGCWRDNVVKSWPQEKVVAKPLNWGWRIMLYSFYFCKERCKWCRFRGLSWFHFTHILA